MKTPTKTLPNGVTVYLGEMANIALEDVDMAHTWVNRDGAPRDECFMSTRTDSYTYGKGAGVRTYDPIPYSPFVDLLRLRVRDIVDVEYEACFSNKYTDQQKHLGWHADDSPSINHAFGIVVVSFGAEREIWFRENNKAAQDAVRAVCECKTCGATFGSRHGRNCVNADEPYVCQKDEHVLPPEWKTEIIKQPMPHGTVLVMPAGFQQTHQHRIPKHAAACATRISLTFRKLL